MRNNINLLCDVPPVHRLMHLRKEQTGVQKRWDDDTHTQKLPRRVSLLHQHKAPHDTIHQQRHHQRRNSIITGTNQPELWHYSHVSYTSFM